MAEIRLFSLAAALLKLLVVLLRLSRKIIHRYADLLRPARVAIRLNTYPVCSISSHVLIPFLQPLCKTLEEAPGLLEFRFLAPRR